MRNFLLACILLPLVSFSQTAEDALRFLQMNEPSWACEKYAHNTFIQRIEFSLSPDNSTLTMKVKRPEYSSFTGYFIIEISLSEVTQITLQDSESCAGVYIATNPYGIKAKVVSRDGVLENSISDLNSFFESKGWKDDSIRLRVNDQIDERSERIIKALKFLAEQAGAKITESHF